MWRIATGGAAHRYDGCPVKTLCVYADDSFTGKEVDLTRAGLSNKLAKRMNDRASSMQNHRGTAAFLYARRDGKGASFCIEPHSYAVAGDLGTFEDRASSTRISKRAHCPL